MKSTIPKSCLIAILAALVFGCLLTSCEKKNTDYEGEAQYYHNLDDTIYKKFNIDKPKETIKFVDSIFSKLKSVNGYGHYYYYNRHRNYYNAIEDYRTSDLYADSAIKALEDENLQLHYPEQYAYALLSKGGTAFSLHNYNTSYEYYYRAITFAKRNLDVCKLKDYSYAVAMTLYSQKKYAESAKNFEQAFDEYSICKDDKRDAWHMQEIINNTALCFTKLDKADSALFYYDKALSFIKTNVASHVTPEDVKKANAVIYGNMGKVYFKKGELDRAEQLFIRSIEVNLQPFGDHKDAQLEQVQLARLYLKRNQLPQMHAVLVALKNEFTIEKDENARLDWLQLMSQYDDLNHDRSGAFDYYRNYVSMRDSINEVNKQAFQTDILQQLKDKEQQIQIDTLKRDNRQNRIYLWISIIMIIMALTIIVSVYFYYRRGKQNIRTLSLLNQEISEQKDKLEFAMAELQKSNAGKDKILKAVAHDLRNPIGGISMLAATLLEDDQHNEEDTKVLQMIEKSSQNSLQLINDLLEINIKEDTIHLKKHEVEVNDFARQVVAIMNLNADKKSQYIQLILLPQPLKVNLDKDKIERVINNLLSNAIKFSPAGATIILELQRDENSVFFIVKDKGVGIPVDMQADLFNTFTGAMRKGTAGERSFGLGLSICKQIVESHKGRIWISSTEGEGTDCFVELPIS